jgi:2-polyprenyl-3-methyl-5-hydroxy-6-metoxy-1,4-benzoquinol methylase
MGVDRHAPSIERAQANAREAGVEGRARFEAVRIEQLSSNTQFDVVTSFDVIHDLADPVGVLRSIRTYLAPGGSYVMVEGKGTTAWSMAICKCGWGTVSACFIACRNHLLRGCWPGRPPA